MRRVYGEGEMDTRKPTGPLPEIVLPEKGCWEKLGKRGYDKRWRELNKERIQMQRRKAYRETCVPNNTGGKAWNKIKDATLPEVVTPNLPHLKFRDKEYLKAYNHLNLGRKKALKGRCGGYEREAKKSHQRQLDFLKANGVWPTSFINNKTMAGAHNRFREWTLKDLKAVESRDFTDLELTKILGRTLMAIKFQRWKLKKKSKLGNK